MITMVPKELREEFVIKVKDRKMVEEQKVSNSDMIQFNHYACILEDSLY